MDFARERAFAADESGDSPLAFKLWGELAEAGTDGVASLKYGALAIELEKWDVAESALMEASRLLPQASIVAALLGSLWTCRTDGDQAESLPTAKQWFLKSLEYKRTAPALTLLGSVFGRLGEIAKAKNAFEEALAIDADYEEAMYNLATLEEEDDPPRCLAFLKRAVEIDPNYLLAHQALGRHFQKLGDRTLAELHFRRCLEIDPDNYWSSLFLANLLGVMGKNEEAKQTYQHAVDLEPDLEGGWRFFANFLASIGEQAEAAELRSKAKRIIMQD